MMKYFWELPQNLIGLFLVWLTKAVRKKVKFGEENCVYYVAQRFNSLWSGVSLGNYIVLAKGKYATEITIRHEHGHQIQSKYLGWFYLILIGIPSFLANILCRIIWFPYYSTPWEFTADKLGGVDRYAQSEV